MRLYIYTDRSFGPKARATAGQELFRTEAVDILSADEQFRSATGLMPASDTSIWCSVEVLP